MGCAGWGGARIEWDGGGPVVVEERVFVELGFESGEVGGEEGEVGG